MVDEGIRGLTSNPTIFAKAVATGQYDDLIRREISAGDDARQIYEQIAVSDVGDAADVLRPVYDQADGADGFASIEVEPDLAADSDGTLARARELWSLLDRPNVFVKIPATEEGIPAIEAAIAEGINVNVTLMFSVEVYKRVARAYVAGLRTRLERGQDVTRVASVASFFVSRVDTKVDAYLEELGTRAAMTARGRAAIANAKLAYAAFSEIFGGDGFADLQAAGARVQRCLWARRARRTPITATSCMSRSSSAHRRSTRCRSIRSRRSSTTGCWSAPSTEIWTARSRRSARSRPTALRWNGSPPS